MRQDIGTAGADQPGYPARVADADWAANLGQVIAERIKYVRTEVRRVSVQQLADRCKAAGYAISRSNLSALENGKRTAISIAELLAIAAALEVPLALLLTPAGTGTTVPPVPGLEVEDWQALRWLVADAPLPGHGETWQQDAAVVHELRRHDDLVSQWRADIEQADEFGARFTAAASDQSEAGRAKRESLTGPRAAFERAAHGTGRRLASMRASMRERGLVPPELPERLVWVDDPRAREQDFEPPE